VVKAGHQGIDIGVGPDLGGVDEEFPAPDQPRLLAEVDDPREEAGEDLDAEACRIRVRREWSGNGSSRA